MTDLEHVAAGQPHVAAHNAERDSINQLRDEELNKYVLITALNGLVAAILSADPTVVSAATAAVATALSTAGVLNTTSGPGIVFQQGPPENGYAYTIMDPTNHLGLGITLDGRLDAVLKDGIVHLTMLGDDILAGLMQSAVWTTVSNESGYVWSICDLTGHLGIGLLPNGTLDGTITKALYAPPNTDPVTDVIEVKTDGGGLRQLWRNQRPSGTRTKLTTSGDNFEGRITRDGAVLFRQLSGGVTTDKYIQSVSGGPVYPAYSLVTSIAAYGDSLTQGTDTIPWPAAFATMAGIPCLNFGIGGQDSGPIASRQGGNAAPLLADATIPATTTSVTLNLGIDVLQQSGNTAKTALITLAGVPGTLSRAAGVFASGTLYTFVRTTAGSSTLAVAGSLVLCKDGTDYETFGQIFWPGRNDLSHGLGMTGVMTNIDKMINFMKPYVKRYIILGITGATTEIIGSANYNLMIAQNNAAALKYGDNFIDINRYIITNANAIMAAAGITPTSQDALDLANDVIPTSLHYLDTIHFSNVIYNVVAQQAYNKAVAKGWFLT